MQVDLDALGARIVKPPLWIVDEGCSQVGDTRLIGDRAMTRFRDDESLRIRQLLDGDPGPACRRLSVERAAERQCRDIAGNWHMPIFAWLRLDGTATFEKALGGTASNLAHMRVLELGGQCLVAFEAVEGDTLLTGVDIERQA